MKLAEMEQKAREQQRTDNEATLQRIAAEMLAEQEAREKFRQEIITWMVQEADLDAQELEMMLSVTDDVIGELCLSVPEHQPITFHVMQSTRREDGGWRVRDGHFYVAAPGHPPWPINCCSLGEALIEAGTIFQQDREANHGPDANP